MSSLQTGRVLPEGTYRLFGGAGIFRTPSVSPASPDRANFPFLEGGGRFGFTEGWDVGLKYTMPGMFTGDAKFALYEGESWALALGFGLGWLAVKSNDPAASDYFQREIVDLLIPAYLSYDASAVFGIYLSPRFVLRWAQDQQNLLGAALGLRWGDTLGVFLEGAGAVDLTSDFRQAQVGLGLFFGNGPSYPRPKGI